jgi:protein O-GlcNAc transferase
MRKPKRYGHSNVHERLNCKAAQIIERTTRLLLRGAHLEALPILRAAILRHPGNASVLTRYADALHQAEHVAEARDVYRRALALDKGEFQAWYGCGMAEFSSGAYADAIECLCHAVALAPRDADARFYLGKSLFQMGEVDAAIDEFLLAAESTDAGMRRQSLRQIAVIIPGSPSRGNGPVLKARQKWARLEEKIERPQRAGVTRRAVASRKLRIGYVSSFFHHRNWMKPVWGMINRHDRSGFEIHLLTDQGSPSAEGGYRAHPGDFIHDITDLSNEEAAAKISAAGIDVLVDLNGYSAPERLGLFMRKPAPIIVGWFGMYATTGIRAFDYIVGDASVVPPEEEPFYSERVLRVSGSYMAFSVLYPVPPVVPPPCLRARRITFGCLAPQYKITDEVITAWARILGAAPTASLLLKSSCLDDGSNRAAVHSRFARAGIAPERVLLEGSAKHYEFLDAYARVDIALDTFPYNGGTTTAEALWQGVPVLTFNGDRWVSRISRSILVAAGLEEWIESSLKSYAQRAIKLAKSPATSGQLMGLRGRMRERLLASPACDTAALCREMEAHYQLIAGISDGQGRSRNSRPGPSL